MKLELVSSLAIEPALALLPARMASPEARVMLLQGHRRWRGHFS